MNDKPGTGITIFFLSFQHNHQKFLKQSEIDGIVAKDFNIHKGRLPLDLQKSVIKIDEALAIAREKLLQNIADGYNGLVVLEFPFRDGGVRTPIWAERAPLKPRVK